MLTFVIPVRHHENSRDWDLTKNLLLQTACSVANQRSFHWRGIVVANRDSQIPILPAGFRLVSVDFPPNPIHEIREHDHEHAMDVFRLDKGRRVLAGMREANAKGHIMILDDDDLVSNRLAEHASAYHQSNGWVIRSGYAWNGRILARMPVFNGSCGSCNIVKASLYDLSRDDPEYLRHVYGSHAPQVDMFGLENLPFAGAIYRVGHMNSHSANRIPEGSTPVKWNQRIVREFGLMR